MEPKVWGVGTSKKIKSGREIILGRNFNQIKTENGLIRIISKEYEYRKTGERTIVASPKAYEDVIVNAEMEIINEKSINVRFTIKSPNVNIEEPVLGHIDVINSENAPKISYSNGIWVAIIKLVIALVEELSKKDESCTDKAIRACGEGNVAEVDEGGWFSGCHYKCK